MYTIKWWYHIDTHLLGAVGKQHRIMVIHFMRYVHHLTKIYSGFRCREFSLMNFQRGSTPVVPSAPSESIAFCAVEELRGRKHPGLLGPFPPIEYIFKICVQVGAQNFWSSIAPSRPLATSEDSKAFIVCCMIPIRSWLVAPAFLSIWLHEVKNSWFILLVSME